MPDARPREELGALLRDMLDCPMCATTDPLAGILAPPKGDTKPLRVVAFRARSIRLECRGCGLRFSVDPENLADVYADREAPPPSRIEADARERAAGDPAAYLPALVEVQRRAGLFRAKQRERILGPHRRGVEQAAPRKGRIRFPKR